MRPLADHVYYEGWFQTTDLICCLCHTYIAIFLLIALSHVFSQIQLLRQDIMLY